MLWIGSYTFQSLCDCLFDIVVELCSPTFSAGGNKGLLWETLLYKTYSKKLNYSMDPFDFREDVAYTGRRLGGKDRISIDFSDLIGGA